MMIPGVEIDLADPEATQDLQQLRQAIESFGPDQCQCEGGMVKLDGFKTPLYPYQIMGVSWVLN